MVVYVDDTVITADDAQEITDLKIISTTVFSNKRPWFFMIFLKY